MERIKPNDSQRRTPPRSNQSLPVRPVTPTNGFMNNNGPQIEEDFSENKKETKKKTRWVGISFGILGILVLALLGFLLMTVLSKDEQPAPNSPAIQTNQLGQKSSGKGIVSGDPTPVKWPADVKPTRMEIQANPKTGEPTLMLVGDKEGMGTLVRQYSENGDLINHWLITPSTDDSLSNTPTKEAK